MVGHAPCDEVAQHVDNIIVLLHHNADLSTALMHC